MAKLYIFGIGGTGSRVLRSLTMLLAAGVDMNGYDIVPIIIDPDNSNSDLTKNARLLDSYISLRKQLSFSEGNKNHFFSTSIEKIISNFQLLIEKTNDNTFKQFIGLSNMSKENQAMAQMLFSDDNLNSDMNEGFKGNPNIGSIVLNQMVASSDFDTFTNSFANGDKIFIISSIFGGTGASGFPLLLKTLRYNEDMDNHDIINKAEIGAVTVLPYFKLKTNSESAIDSATFISKTKSALKYYESNIVGSNDINALYYLGDDASNIYENNEGGTLQENDAHLIELLAATAIVDFVHKTHEGRTTENLELSVSELGGSITFNNFYEKLQGMLRKPLTQFILMANCFEDKKDFISSKKLDANKNINDIDAFYKSSFITNLCGFLDSYKKWLSEMKENNLSLNLFNLRTGNKPFEVVTDMKTYKAGPFKELFNSDYDLFYTYLNDAKTESKDDKDKLVERFFIATKKLAEDKYKF